MCPQEYHHNTGTAVGGEKTKNKARKGHTIGNKLTGISMLCSLETKNNQTIWMTSFVVIFELSFDNISLQGDFRIIRFKIILRVLCSSWVPVSIQQFPHRGQLPQTGHMTRSLQVWGENLMNLDMSSLYLLDLYSFTYTLPYRFLPVYWLSWITLKIWTVLIQ